jgi:hypothetical protein
MVHMRRIDYVVSGERPAVTDLVQRRARALLVLGGAIGPPAGRLIEGARPLVLAQHPEHGIREAALAQVRHRPVEQRASKFQAPRDVAVAPYHSGS